MGTLLKTVGQYHKGETSKDEKQKVNVEEWAKGESVVRYQVRGRLNEAPSDMSHKKAESRD